MTCTANTGNAGSLYCSDGSIFGLPYAVVLAKEAVEFTAADFLDNSKWIDKIESGDIFPLVEMKDFVDNKTDPTYHEWADESRKIMRQGKYRFQAMYDLAECQKKELIKFRKFSGRIFFVYQDNVLRGSSIDSGVTIKGMRLGMFNVVKESFSLMDGTAANTMIEFDLKSEKDANEFDYSREVTWDVADTDNLDSLTPVDITVIGTPTATEIVVGVNGNCYGEAYPVIGIAAEVAAFPVLPVAASSVVDNADGTYTLTGTGMSTGSVDLGAPSARSDSKLAVSSGAATVTIT